MPRRVLTIGHGGCTFTPSQTRTGAIPNAGGRQTPTGLARKRGTCRRFAVLAAPPSRRACLSSPLQPLLSSPAPAAGSTRLAMCESGARFHFTSWGDVFRAGSMGWVDYGVDLRPEKQHRRGDEKIEEQHDHAAQTAIGGAIIAEVLDVGGEPQRGKDPDDDRANRTRCHVAKRLINVGAQVVD